MQPGDRLILRIEKAVAGGRMLARHEGLIVLVAAAIPGEVVEAEVERLQRGTLWAHTRRVLEPSPDRVEPFCDWACGGSVFAHVRYERQLELKGEILRDAFARLARLPLASDVPVAASPPDGFRMRARLHLRHGRLGFFREGTHELCEAGPTRQLLPGAIEAVRALEAALDGRAGRGVREVELAENCAATDRVFHLDLEPDADPSGLARLAEISGVTGLSCSSGMQRRALTLAGSPRVTDTLAGVSLTRHARAFFQGNRFLLETLVARVRDRVPPGAMLDLYAGVGLFSTVLAARGDSRVVAVEGDATSAEDLKRNLSPFRAQASAYHQSVEAYVAASRRAPHVATIVVDPPRSGMSREALQGVLARNAPRIVYVSCDVATLARDVRAAIERGYRLASLEALDLFPHTAHVETIAVLVNS